MTYEIKWFNEIEWWFRAHEMKKWLNDDFERREREDVIRNKYTNWI